MRRVSRSLFIALVAGAAFASPAMAEDVYKWTDSKGVTHYADAPPDGTKYEKLNVSRGTSRRAEEPVAETTDGAATTEVATAASAAAASSPNCLQARANLDTLRNNPVVRKDTDGDGVPEDISGDQLQAEIARAQQLTEVYCK
jgi:hypothetical protein